MDDEFDYDEGGEGGPKSVVRNMPHDEEVDLDNEDDSMGGGRGGAGPGRAQPVQNLPHDEEVSLSGDEGPRSGGSPSPGGGQMPGPAGRSSGSIGGGNSMDTGGMGRRHDEEDRRGGGALSGGYDDSPGSKGSEPAGVIHGGGLGYNPDDFARLSVAEEVKELFAYIGRYKPHTVPLEIKLKPFLPDYIAAVGDIDEFIKVPRPDGQPDYLGLKILDEPAAVQSDPTLLQLQLRAASKETTLAPMAVSRVEERDTAKRAEAIDKWVRNIEDLHKRKPAAAVSYSRPMPDVEALMAQWPPALEDALRGAQLTEDIAVDLRQLARICLAIVGIPVHGSLVEPLHLLFTVYLEFKANPFLSEGAARGAYTGPGSGDAATGLGEQAPW